MSRKCGALALSLLRESVAFATGLLIGKAWARRMATRGSLAGSSDVRPLEAVAKVLKLMERDRNAREK